jgi:hypothetical protein
MKDLSNESLLNEYRKLAESNGAQEMIDFDLFKEIEEKILNRMHNNETMWEKYMGEDL